MKPATLSTYHLTRGNTYKEILQFSANGQPVDLTQFTAIKMDIRAAQNPDSQLLKSVQLGQGIEVEANTLTITIDATETRQWAPGTWFRDLVVQTPTGEVYTWAQGHIAVLSNITSHA